MQNKTDSALIALRQILRVTEMNSRALASDVELTPSQLLILQIVGKMDEALPSAIAREASITQATVTNLIDKLEKRGMVTRRRDDRDKRRVLIDLTKLGSQILEKAPDLLQDRFETGFAGLEAWEQSFIIAALERVAVILEANTLDASPVLDIGAIDQTLLD